MLPHTQSASVEGIHCGIGAVNNSGVDAEVDGDNSDEDSDRGFYYDKPSVVSMRKNSKETNSLRESFVCICVLCHERLRGMRRRTAHTNCILCASPR